MWMKRENGREYFAMNNSEVITFLHEKLKNNKKLVIYDFDDKVFLESLGNRIKDKYIILTSLDFNCVHENEIEVLSKVMLSDIVELSRLYEFSDKIVVLSKLSQFAGVFNYYDAGLLNQEELIKAILV